MACVVVWLGWYNLRLQKGVGEMAEIDTNLTDMLSPPRSAPEQLSVQGQTIQESMRLLLLVQRYQFLGHLRANLDPLSLWQRPHIPDLEPSLYGFTEDGEKKFLGTEKRRGEERRGGEKKERGFLRLGIHAFASESRNFPPALR